MPILIAVLVLTICLSTACGNDDAARDSSRATSDTTAEGAPLTDTTTETDLLAEPGATAADASDIRADSPEKGPISEWSMAPVRERRSVPSIPVIHALRGGRHDAYDRFVVEFRGDAVPTYTLRYLDEPPIECGSGHAIELADGAVLELHLEPARGHTDEGSATVDHGERSFDFPVLNEAEVSCDFEAVFTVVLGVKERLPFRIQELEKPTRLVIDVLHPEA